MVDLEKAKIEVESSSSECNPAGLTAHKCTHSTPSAIPEDNAPDTAEYTFPEGGTRAWMTVFGAALFLFCTGPQTAFGIFQSWYSEHQLRHTSLSDISWIGSLAACLIYFTGLFAGRIFDLYGPHVLLIPGSVLLVSGAMLTSICTHFYQFLIAQGLCMGLSYGMISYPPLAAISTHFQRRRAAAIGIAFIAEGLGSGFFPIFYHFLFARFDFGWAVRLGGFLMLALCVIGNLMVTSRLPHHDHLKRRHASPTASTTTTARKSLLANTGVALRDAPFLLFSVGSVFVNFGIGIPRTYIVTYAVTHGVPESKSFYVSSALAAGQVAGFLFLAAFADAIGPFNIAALSTFIAGTLVLVAWRLANSLPSVMTFIVFFGCFKGAFLAMNAPCIMQISHLAEVGTRTGFAYTLVSIAVLVSAPLAGKLVSEQGNYDGMILLCGFAFVIGSVFILAAKLKVNPSILGRI